MRFQDDARRVIFEGVKKLAKAVKITLGPTGRNVIIKKDGQAPFITKDGVTVANEVVLEDDFENLGVELIREVASKTATNVGDGTTTATVLAESLLEAGSRHLMSGINAFELKAGIDLAVTKVDECLSKMAKPVKSKKEMCQVATVAANGDSEIGTMISDLIYDIGPEGVATIEKTRGASTYIDRVDGLQITGGLASPYFATQEQPPL